MMLKFLPCPPPPLVRVREPLRPGGRKRPAEDPAPDASRISSSSLQSLNPRVGEQEASLFPKRAKAQQPARLPDSKEAPPSRDEAFTRLRNATLGPKPSLEAVRRCAQDLSNATEGDLAVDHELRCWAMGKLVAAAKELPSAATVRLAQALGELFGGRDIGGACGATLIGLLLSPTSTLTEGQLQAIANGLARAGVIDGWPEPRVALCQLHMQLTCALTPAEQVTSTTGLTRLVGHVAQKPAAYAALIEAFGQKAGSVSLRRLAFLAQGIARGLPGPTGCDRLADAVATILRARTLPEERIDKIMLAVLNPNGAPSPGPTRAERASRVLTHLLAQSERLPFNACARVFRHLFAELLAQGGKENAAQDFIARIWGAPSDGLAGPAAFALGTTVGDQPALRRKLLQALAQAPWTPSPGTPPTRTVNAVLNLVDGMSFHLHHQTRGDTPVAERRKQLDSLVDDVLQYLAHAPLSHWGPSMMGLVRGLGAHRIADADLDGMLERLLHAASTAPTPQLTRLAQGLGAGVGGPTASSEKRQRIERAISDTRAPLSAEQAQALRSGLELAWKASS